MSNVYRILHVVPNLALYKGGPSRSVVCLTNSICNSEHFSIHLWSCSNEGEVVLESSKEVRRTSIDTGGGIRRHLGLNFRKKLFSMPRGTFDLLRIHGVWDPVCHWAAKYAQINGVPYYIHPRGMLEPWSLGHKRLKKKLAYNLYQKQDLTRSCLLISTSELERENLASLQLGVDIALIPNAVDIAPPERLNKVNTRSQNTALFLSRVHPKKGVLELLQAWARVAPESWLLRIVGPGEDSFLKEVRKQIALLDLEKSVFLVGEVDGSDREREFENADIFILPSFSENFGMAIVEALGYGLPVVTTKQTPWQIIEREECGWWIETGVEALVDTLPSALYTSLERKAFIRGRARKIAEIFDSCSIS